MDETDPQPGTGSIATPPPYGTDFQPEAKLADDGVGFSPAPDDDVASREAVAPPTSPTPAGTEAPAPATTADAIKAGAQRLTGQAGEQVRTLADQGKERATGALDQVVQLLTDAAHQVDDKLGTSYGDYARQAAGQVSGLADQIRAKNVDELLEDARELVGRAPGVAIGVSAAVGFVVARLVSAGLDGREAA